MLCVRQRVRYIHLGVRTHLRVAPVTCSNSLGCVMRCCFGNARNTALQLDFANRGAQRDLASLIRLHRCAALRVARRAAEHAGFPNTARNACDLPTWPPLSRLLSLTMGSVIQIAIACGVKCVAVAYKNHICSDLLCAQCVSDTKPINSTNTRDCFKPNCCRFRSHY